MRVLCASLLALTFLTGLTARPAAQDKTAVRFGIEANLENFPQKTPQLALKSVLKAMEESKIDYLLAHLADPAFVKGRLKIYKTGMSAALTEESKDTLAFQRLVKATTENFRDDPTKVKELARFTKEGEFEAGDDVAEVRLKSLPARKVFLKKIDNLWYLQDRDK